ncbi:MAG: ABC transporter ATP-binding protein [Ruminococcaceae bacterium]|nr:ABC transporter ATP-binding protein [Oscillospiraceae bacterium]
MKKNMLGLLKGHYGTYFCMLFLIIIAAILGLLNPFFTKTIVDDVLLGGNTNLIIPVVLGIAGVAAGRLFLRYFAQMKIESITQKMVLGLRRRGFRKLMELDFEYFDRHSTGETMTQMTSDIDTVRQFFAHTVFTALENIAIFLGAILILVFYINLRLSAILLFVIPVVSILTTQMAKQQKKRYRHLRTVQADLNTVVSENIWAQRAVKAFVREDYENKRMDGVNKEFREAQMDIAMTSRKYLPFLQNIYGIVQLYMVFIGGVLVIQDVITLGDLIMFNSMIWMVTGPLTMVGALTNATINSFASYEKMMALLEEEPKISNEKEVQNTSVLGKVEFDNVSLSYEGTSALKNISFMAEPGMRIGIMGQTGSGKTSLIQLISRFYDPDEGVILIDDIPLQELDLETVRNSVSASQQEVFLFSDTVGANISYGNPKASMEEIKRAAQIAMADEFIEKLPEGYETVIGERGVTLSGGQKQRLSLARAILKNPAILVLDDTTSALDSETEEKIREALSKNCTDKTVFIISQKISSVKDCDMILVLKEGELIQKGTHFELLSQQEGYYYGVYVHQYGGGIHG